MKHKIEAEGIRIQWKEIKKWERQRQIYQIYKEIMMLMSRPFTCPFQQYTPLQQCVHFSICLYKVCKSEILNCNWLILLYLSIPISLCHTFLVLGSIGVVMHIFGKVDLGIFGLCLVGYTCVVCSNFSVQLSYCRHSQFQDYFCHHCAKIPSIVSLKNRARDDFTIEKCPLAPGTGTVRIIKKKQDLIYMESGGGLPVYI